MGCLRHGTRVRQANILRGQFRHWSYWNPASWHWREGISYLNPYAYGYSEEVEAARTQNLQDAQVLAAPEKVEITEIPKVESLPESASDFADILTDEPLLTTIHETGEWFFNPVIYAMDGLHFCGASWPIAVVLVSVPIRIAATFYKQTATNKQRTQMFEKTFLEQMTKMQHNLAARVQGTGLKHLGDHMNKPNLCK